MNADRRFSDVHRNVLRSLVGLMIPASDEYALPGADDDDIFADIENTAAPSTDFLGQGFAAIESLSKARHQKPFAALVAADQMALVSELEKTHGSVVRALVGITTQCYYRDGRVMAALDMEARPPFPGGFNLPNGDWSLLDPVRKRPRLYRQP